MADESSAAGQRFSEDLRRIREERGISLDELHDETRLARTLIESFEKGQLYDHPTYNRVYLRSFIKAYSEAVDISQEAALAGLDAALDGSYQHDLADQYLGAPPEVSSDWDDAGGEDSSGESTASSSSEGDTISTAGAPTAGGVEGRGGIVGPPRALGEESPPEEHRQELSEQEYQVEEPGTKEPASETDESSSPPEEEGQGEEESNEDESASPDLSAEEPETPKDEESKLDPSASPPPWREGDEPEDSDVQGGSSSPSASPEEPSFEDTGEMGIMGEPTELEAGEEGASEPASHSPPQTTASPSDPESSESFLGGNRKIYLTGIGIAVVLLVLVGLGVAYFSTGDTAATAQEPAPAIDTASTAAQKDTSAAEDQQPPPASVTLGETIHLTVLATDNVSNLRIRRDDDLRRPYWIQAGQAEVYPFQRQAMLENELSDIRLFLEGYPYPISPRDTVGGLEITRAQAEAFVDTLRGTPPALSVSPDTIPVGSPVNEPIGGGDSLE